MIDITEIQLILAPVIEAKKSLKRNKSPYAKKNDRPIEYFEGYQKFVEWKDAISNHTVKGKIPYKLIEKRAPNQTDQELQYMIDNYKQNTLPVSFEFLSTISRGLHDGNWSIDFPEESSTYVNSETTFKNYVEVEIAKTPLQMSVDSWVKFLVPSVKINDSMGVIAVKPYKEEKLVEVDGEYVIAGDELPEPIPYYYGCERVLNDITDGYALIEMNRYSIVKVAGKDVREGLVFELYDDENIWVIEQTGAAHEYTFAEPRLYFNHGLGFLPVKYLMGMPVPCDSGSTVWQSPFLMVSDILDEATLDAMFLRGSKASCVYPQKVMLGNECQFTDEHNNRCQGGYIPNKDMQGFYKCTECHGTGMAARTSPINTIFVKGKSMSDDGDAIKPADALAFVSPSVDVPKFLRDEIEGAILSALSILHLKTTNTVVKGAEDMTATGMVMDEKGKYAFIKSVVDQIFDIYEFILKSIGGMRYGDDFKMPHINRPISYDFNTEGDYLMQISAAQSAGAPPVVIASYVYKYLKAIFYDNPKTALAYDVIIAADRLFTMTKDQINTEIPRNLVQGWEVVLHDSALTFIAELQRENPNYLTQTMDEMIADLKAKAVENTPVQPVSTIRGNPASILANANA